MILLGIIWTCQIVVIFVFAVGEILGKPCQADTDEDGDQASLPPHWRDRSFEEVTHLRLIDHEKFRRSPAMRFGNIMDNLFLPIYIVLALPWILGSTMAVRRGRRGERGQG